MKSALRWCVVPLLATTLLAQTTVKPAAKKKAATPTQPAVTVQDVQSLRDALAAQQRQIEQLQQQLQQRDQAWQQSQQQLQQAQSAATAAQQKADSAETVATQQKDSVDKLNNDMADVKTTLTNNAVGTQDEQKRVSAIESLAGRFRFSGDVRVRSDSIFQKGSSDRNRGRIRVRLGIDGKLNEDFVGGLALASGTLLDPTSTNESLTNFFEKKTVGLDRGYVTYNPVAHKWLSLTGGKFAYTWQRTSMTFDSDLNPEGFSQKVSFDLHSPIVKNFTFQLMQLLYSEASGGTDSYALGGQVSAKLEFGKRWSSTPSFTLLNFNSPNALLAASSSTASCVAPTGTPTGTCGFGPNGLTNATTTIGGKAAFLSGYEYADFIWNNQIQTGLPRLPINLQLEFEKNLKAANHPLDSTGTIVLTNLGSQANAYGFDFSVGQTKNKNDVQIGYAWLRQEQDSALASFVESDQRAPTNILQHRFYVLWKVRANTVASFTYWRGHTLNTFLENAKRGTGVPVGGTDPAYSRLFFDLVYSF